MDDNVWNDKDTDDFLRYLKYEYFLCSYYGLKVLMQIYIGFIPREDILIFGENQFDPVQIIFILLLVQSGVAIMNVTLILSNVDEDKIDVEGDVYARSGYSKFAYIKSIVYIAVFTTIIVLFFTNNWLEGNNIMAVQWI